MFPQSTYLVKLGKQSVDWDARKVRIQFKEKSLDSRLGWYTNWDCHPREHVTKDWWHGHLLSWRGGDK
jgi:hypothetical protein